MWPVSKWMCYLLGKIKNLIHWFQWAKISKSCQKEASVNQRGNLGTEHCAFGEDALLLLLAIRAQTYSTLLWRVHPPEGSKPLVPSSWVTQPSWVTSSVAIPGIATYSWPCITSPTGPRVTWFPTTAEQPQQKSSTGSSSATFYRVTRDGNLRQRCLVRSVSSWALWRPAQPSSPPRSPHSAEIPEMPESIGPTPAVLMFGMELHILTCCSSQRGTEGTRNGICATLTLNTCVASRRFWHDISDVDKVSYKLGTIRV